VNSRKKTEAVTPPETVGKLLGAAGDDLVLVGGQALAVWVNWYDLALSKTRVPAISNDVDFLSPSAVDRESVRRFARVLRGQVIYPNEKALTALVGQAYLEISDEEYLNVDVIFKVVGLEGDAVRKRAVRIEPQGQPAFRVMHPLDVLYSRLINLHKLQDKQNDKGRMQLALAIDVGRAFLRREASGLDPAATAQGRSPLQGFVSAVERMAVEDAGRKVAQRHGLHVADAIDPLLIPPGPFWAKRWPKLKTLMSPDYARRISPQDLP